MESGRSRKLVKTGRGRQAALMLLLAFSGLALSCACSGKAADTKQPSAGKASPEKPGEGSAEILGGWQAIKPDSRNAVAARDFLNDYLSAENIVLKEIIEARQQVVAGFKVYLICRTGDGGYLCALVLLASDGSTRVLEIDYDCRPSAGQ